MKVLLVLNQLDRSEDFFVYLSSRKWANSDEIKLLTVLDTYEFDPSISYDKEAVVKERQEKLSQLVDKFKSNYPEVEVTSELLQGRPAEKIIKACEKESVDMVAINAFESVDSFGSYLGGVASTVLVNAPCSVMLIKATENGSPCKNLLIPVDKSPHSQSAFEHLLNTNWSKDVRFNVVSVIENIGDHMKFEHENEAYSAQLRERSEFMHKEALELVTGYAKKLNDKFGVDRATHEVLRGHVREQILSVAQTVKADLIVMGSHGRGFMEALALGSVSQTVAQQCTCSIEVIRVPNSQINAIMDELTGSTYK